MPFLELCGFSLVGRDSKAVLVNTNVVLRVRRLRVFFWILMQYKQAIVLSYKKSKVKHLAFLFC